MIRITADLDNCLISVATTRTKAISEYLTKYRKVIIETTQIIKSSSGKGCHVILWTNTNLSSDEIMFIRCLLGDDWKRVRLDRARRYSPQYLFSEKKYLSKNHK